MFPFHARFYGVWRVDDLSRFVRLVEYNYQKLNSTQYYVPPSKDHTGDLTCDCNTVLYR